MLIQDGADKIGEFGYAHYSGRPITPGIHTIHFTPQSIADGWEANCSCGQWRAFADIFEFQSRDCLINALNDKHQQHVLLALRALEGDV